MKQMYDGHADARLMIVGGLRGRAEAASLGGVRRPRPTPAPQAGMPVE